MHDLSYCLRGVNRQGYFIAMDKKRIFFFYFAISNHLEFDSSLSFVMNLISDRDKRGNGVEEATHARSPRRIDFLFSRSFQNIPFLRINSFHQVKLQFSSLISKGL